MEQRGRLFPFLDDLYLQSGGSFRINNGDVQGGPEAVINGVMTPIYCEITPAVTQSFLAGPMSLHLQYTDRLEAHQKCASPSFTASTFAGQAPCDPNGAIAHRSGEKQQRLKVQGPTSCRFLYSNARLLLQALRMFFVASNHPSANSAAVPNVNIKQGAIIRPTESDQPLVGGEYLIESPHSCTNITFVPWYILWDTERRFVLIQPGYLRPNPSHWMTSLGISIPGIFFFRAT